MEDAKNLCVLWVFEVEKITPKCAKKNPEKHEKDLDLNFVPFGLFRVLRGWYPIGTFHAVTCICPAVFPPES
jgi:hypothetical protein